MSSIWYAAFSQDFVEPAKEIFRKLNKDVKVQVWDPEILPDMISKGVQVILARGATAIRIRKITTLPIVEIPIPFEDMVDTLIEASGYGRNIGVIGYNNLLGGLELLNPILNVNIRQVFAVDTEDTYRQIAKWKEDKVDVVVGGLIQTHFAKQLDMKYVRIDLSEKALNHACLEAEKILESVIAATKRAEELKTILNTTKENYIAVDPEGKITLINQTASRYLPSASLSAEGDIITDLFPVFKSIWNVLKEGTEILQETATLKGIEILYDIIPLKYRDNQILGAVITFNDIQTITKGEHKIRDRVKKGFYAKYCFDDICGESPAIKSCIHIARKYAHADFTVLIMGETGTGKELFAQSIHQSSARSHGPFVAVNCAALPEGILESELFGYEEGAFTGARKNGKMGLFELAHEGTIFLDEISEMPLSLQSRLLRVLQDNRVMRLGGDRMIPINVRVIAATNRNLMTSVKENRFRSDLFYRLNVLTLKIPSLRDRVADIPLLTTLFLKEGSAAFTCTEDGLAALAKYQWPGNVRQFMHFIEKVKIISEAKKLDGPMLRSIIEQYEPEIDYESKEEPRRAQAVTREELEHALTLSDGDKTRAAQILGIHRSTFWRCMKKYNIE